MLRLKNEGSARFSLPTQGMDVTLTDSVSVDFMEPLEVVGGDSKKRPVSVVRLD